MACWHDGPIIKLFTSTVLYPLFGWKGDHVVGVTGNLKRKKREIKRKRGHDE